MESTISLALSKQVALRRRLDVVANNMANVDTPGFKLEGQVVQTMRRKEGPDPILYPIDRGSFTDPTEGRRVETGNSLDVALDPEGYLALQVDGAKRYTRDGRMTRAPDGTLISVSGHPVLTADGGTITIPDDSSEIVIARDGTVTADGNDLGRIGIFRPDGSDSTRRREDGLVKFEKEPLAWDQGRLEQGSLEQSNVEGVIEMTDMIELHRNYQYVQKLLDDEDERIRKLVSTVGRP